MAQDGRRQRADVLFDHMGAAIQEGAGFRSEDEELRGAGAGSPAHVAGDELRRIRLFRTGRGRELHGESHEVFADRHLPDEIVEPEDIVGVEQRLDGFGRLAGGGLDDADFVGLGQVVHHHVEHEAVELGLGQGIGALHLDRVLRGEDEERFRQRVADAGRGDLVFLHRFEKGGLGLRRSAVDLVGQEHVREDRSGHEGHAAAFAGVLEDLGAGDVGRHQVGRELHAAELQVEDLGDGFDEERLGQAGRAGDEAMAAGEEGDEDLVDDLPLAHDGLREFTADGLPAAGEFFDKFLFGRNDVGEGGRLHGDQMETNQCVIM